MKKSRHKWTITIADVITPTQDEKEKYYANIFACSNCGLFKAVGRPPRYKTLLTRYRIQTGKNKFQEFRHAPSCPTIPLL